MNPLRFRDRFSAEDSRSATVGAPRQTPAMEQPFLGREALDAGRLTSHRLRTDYAILFPGVYVPVDTTVTARVRAQAAYLWSRRRGIVAGRSAAAVHGAK